ncbi:MAG TPA: YetF domain-containing protein, partial [Candidatus Acidoferrales bacterium]|nr:YetF domain-containing protein [Candidatus Acidoferrales bacterium]
ALNYWVVRLLYGHERIDELVEGSATMLIDGGKILADNLKRELITVNELESAAHKQGLASLDDIERAVLETGGSITFTAREPSAEATRHAEITARLDTLTQQLNALAARFSAGATPR